MNRKRLVELGAVAFVALVLIWDQAPIANSPPSAPERQAAAESHQRPIPSASPVKRTGKERTEGLVTRENFRIGPPAEADGSAETSKDALHVAR